MKAFDFLVATLAATTISSTALSYGYGNGGYDYGHNRAEIAHLRADCVERDVDTFVLKFYNTPVTSRGVSKAIPIKKLLSENCRISGYEMRSIEAVTVKAEPYQDTSVTLLSNGYESRPQWLYKTWRHEEKEATFFLRHNDSEGKLQIHIDGDIDLKIIVIDTEQVRRGPVYDSPRRPRGPVYEAPRGPRGPGGNRGPVYTPPRGPKFDSVTVKCVSKDKKYSECHAGNAVDIQLLNQISEARCTKGRSYGLIQGKGMWVDKGCRGNFSIKVKI